VFTVEERDVLREHVLGLAETDPRVVAGAEVGSLATGAGDRWSDLDLTFGVEDGSSIGEVLEDFTHDLVDNREAVKLFDLPFESTIYRVFLLPGSLQFDLSFTPASEFGARGPKFALLFGDAVERAHTAAPSARELFGWAAHDAVRARFCIERGRLWQAVYLVGEVRNGAFALACLRRGLEAGYARGVHELPAETAASFEETLVRSVEPEELLRALRSVVAALLREPGDAEDLAAELQGQLEELVR
jgi:hypothetical protein